jgi:endonuclease/exonuclease/phosphatase (EEP) superfamily protein YafD
VKLLVYNVNCRNPDVDGTLAVIARIDADLVLLQETSEPWQRALEHLPYPHRAMHLDARAAGGLALLSRAPIEHDELIAATPDGWFPAQRAITFGLEILHVHLRPAMDERGWVTGYVTTPPIRLRQIESYWQHITRQHPVIVAGDYNEEPAGTTCAFLAAQGLARAATAGAKTWRYVRDGRDVLALDIDHVMHDARVIATDARVLDEGMSDHRPLVVELAIAIAIQR